MRAPSVRCSVQVKAAHLVDLVQKRGELPGLLSVVVVRVGLPHSVVVGLLDALPVCPRVQAQDRVVVLPVSVKAGEVVHLLAPWEGCRCGVPISRG